MKSSSQYKSLIGDTLIFALGSVGSKLIMFLLVPFYTHYLTTDEYGTAELVFTVAQLAIPFFSVVIFDAVVRFALMRKHRPQDVLLVGAWVWLLGTAAAVILTPLFGLYGSIAEWKWYITAYVSLNMLLSIELNYLKATDRNLAYSLICIFQTLALACLNILFVAGRKMGVQGYLISYIGANFLAVLAAFFWGRVPRQLKTAAWDKALMRQMVVYSAPLILNNLSWWVVQSSDKLMLESMIDAEALALYTVAAKMPSLISVFVTIFQQAWGISSIKEMDSTNDAGFYTNVFTVYSFLAFLGCIGLCAITKPFMAVYVTESAYQTAWRYVPLLLVSAVYSALAAYCGGMYGALKKSVNNMLSTLMAAVVNIIVNYLGILWWGIWGAMVGTVVSYVLLAFIRMADIRRFVPIQFAWDKLAINTALVLGQAAAVSFLTPAQGYFLSGMAFLLFAVINADELRQMKDRILKRGVR